jgi:hypothetical protein
MRESCTTSCVGRPRLECLRPPIRRGLTLGIPREYFLTLLDPQVAHAFENACGRLREAGITLEDVSIPHVGDITAIYLHIQLSEGAAYHAKTLERQPNDYTPGVRLRLEMGRYVLAEDYARALRGRDVLRREVDATLEGRDGLFLPAMAIPAPKIGATTVRVGSAEEPVRSMMLRCTQTFQRHRPPGHRHPVREHIRGSADRGTAGRCTRRHAAVAPPGANGRALSRTGHVPLRCRPVWQRAAGECLAAAPPGCPAAARR